MLFHWDKKKDEIHKGTVWKKFTFEIEKKDKHCLSKRPPSAHTDWVKGCFTVSKYKEIHIHSIFTVHDCEHNYVISIIMKELVLIIDT